MANETVQWTGRRMFWTKIREMNNCQITGLVNQGKEFGLRKTSHLVKIRKRASGEKVLGLDREKDIRTELEINYFRKGKLLE